MSKSKTLFEQAQKSIPGGVNSPVRAFGSVDLDPLFIKSGRGGTITDADGRTYTDFVGSWGPLIAGHAHPRVTEAITRTAALGSSFGAPTELEITLAEKIIELVPALEMVRMVNSGTEATMSAIRLARGVTGRDKIIKFEGCYHGHGDSFLIKAGSGALTLGEPNSPGVPAALAAETLIANYNDLASVEQVFEAHPGQVAALIVEPVAGNMGVIPPANGFLEGLRQLCTKHGALLIFDEVMTGFRVHPGGAQTLYGIEPDLSTFGKVIGGGLPVGAYGGKAEFMQQVAPSGPVYQAGTLSGNPLAMAAGLATLEVITEPGFFEDLNARANAFFEGAKKYIETENLPLQVNSVNSMGCLFFTAQAVTDFNTATRSDTDKFAAYFAAMLTEGFYLAPSQFEAMFISGAHSQDDLDKTFAAIKRVLTQIL